MGLVPGATFHPPPGYDAAADWAVALNRRLDSIETRAELRSAWEADDAKAHREFLKQHAPDMLRQLVAYVRQRNEELPAA